MKETERGAPDAPEVVSLTTDGVILSNTHTHFRVSCMFQSMLPSSHFPVPVYPPAGAHALITSIEAIGAATAVLPVVSTLVFVFALTSLVTNVEHYETGKCEDGSMDWNMHETRK